GKARQTVAKETQGPVRTEGALITRRLREAVETTPDVRENLVNNLRDKLAKGEYRVDANRLADNLLRESLREDVE
ncbi:MAG: flagellar biosynthesis anti-sigma factor FlgM, partial [Deltaproteobacteria bacterium]|nr:flagellar biosynthesis anti-sigma factor FlgM [Deltaproteobacteria bacterium]